MANPNYNNTYEIEDTQTGKFYKVEGVDGTTREEAIQWLETLDEQALAQREVVKQASQAPTTAAPAAAPQQAAAVAPVQSAGPRQELETNVVYGGVDDAAKVDPRWLGEEGEASYESLAADPNVSWEDLNNFAREQMKAKGMVVPVTAIGGNQEMLDKYRADLAASGGQSAGVVYEDGMSQIVPQQDLDQIEAPEDPSWLDAFERSYQNAVQYGTSGLIARGYHDLMDTGKEAIRAQYPDATDEEIESIHENAIARVQKQMRARGEKLAENDPIIPWIAGELITAGAEDFVGLGGATAAARMATGAGVNATASVGYQAADIQSGVRDEFSGAEVAMDAVFGGALQGAIEAPKAIYRSYKKFGETPNQGSFVRTPDARKGSKKYNEQLDTAVTDIVSVVNDTTTGWSNGPNVTVDANFKERKGVDNDAIGVYLGKGEVAINAEAVLKEAKRLDVDPENIINTVTFHEGLGHFGMDRQFGAKLDDTLLNWYEQSPEFKQDVDAWMLRDSKRAAKTNTPIAYAGDPNRIARIAEEVAAEMSNKGQMDVKLYDRLANMVKDFARAMGMDVNFSRREIKALLAMSQQTVGKKTIRGRAFAPKTAGELGTDSPRYMFMSDEQSVMTDADKEGLQQARIDETLGMNVSPTGRSRTEFGWFKSGDGRWRKELDDSTAEVRIFSEADTQDFREYAEENDLPYSDVYYSLFGRDALSVLADNDLGIDEINLSAVLTHPELYKRYPALQTLKVTLFPEEKGGSSLGMFDHNTGEIFLNRYLVKEQPEMARGTMLHEIQHAIQFMEDLAYGGSPDTVLKQVPDDIIAKNAPNQMLALKNDLKVAEKTAQRLKAMNDSPEDIDAVRGAYNRWLENSEDVNAINDYYKAIERLSLEAGFKSDGQAAERFWNRVGFPTFITPKNEAASRIELMKTFDKPRKIRLYIEGLNDAMRTEDVKTMRSIISKDRKAKFEAYEHLFGEVEARNVDDRKDMTEEERRAIPPLQGEDRVDPDSFIYKKPSDYKKKKATVAASQSSSGPKYMRPGQIDGIKADVEDMTADELFDSENAVDILKGVVSNYEGTLISVDEVEQMAKSRNLSASQIIGSKSNVGEISKRLVMYDIAANKANDKLATLAAKINSGDFTVKDKNEYAKTYAQFLDLTAKIFEEQGEVGRALRIIRELNFTNRRVRGTANALSDLQNALADDEVFARFVKETQTELNAAVSAGKKGKGAELFANVLNTPRAIMSSLDFSAPLRQGIFLVGRPEFWKGLPTMFKSAFSEESYQSLVKDISNRENYPLMVESGVAFSNVDGELSTREEDFMSKWAEKVPGVRRTNAAYVAFLNKLRADTFDSMVKDLRKAGVKFDTPEGEKALKDTGWFISNATGRGSLPKGLNSAAPQLTAAFFSPRLMFSRANMLWPPNYVKLHPVVRRQAIKSLLSFGGFAMTIITLAQQAGLEVEGDPRSSDFGKVRVGNTRYDVLGGFGQYLTLGARMVAFLGGNAYEALTGEEGPAHTKSVSGNFKKYNSGDGMYDPKAGDAVTRFLRNKLSPVASYITDYYQGENVVGEKFDAATSTAERFTPMFMGDLIDMMQEYGMTEGAIRSAPGFFGVGVQDFVPSNLDPEAPLEAPRTFDMKDLEDGENDYIRVSDGVVTVKEPVREAWTERLNELTQVWMFDEMSTPEWENLSDKEKEKIIKEVRSDARKQAKEEILVDLGLD